MSSNDAVDPNATFLRKGKRHPNLLATMALPSNIKEQLTSARCRLGKLADMSLQVVSTPTGELNPGFEKIEKNLSAIVEALDALLTTANTPDLQLKAILKVTSSARESLSMKINALSSSMASHHLQSFMNVLAEEFAIPLLFDGRVRYLHRALMTLLRQAYIFDDTALKKLEEIFLRTLVRPWREDPTTNMPSIFTAPYQVDGIHSPTPALAPNMKPSKQDIMVFLNSIDCLSSTLMSMAPRVFENTFLEILSLLADCLCCCVNNAVLQRRLITLNSVGNDNNSSSPQHGDTNKDNTSHTDNGVVFDEDLGCVRFCVRVVATYTHRYLPDLHALLQEPSHVDADRPFRVRRGALEDLFTRLLRPVFLMLSSTLFPKDVLNACGLLLASMVTVNGCDPFHLNSVCHLVCAELEKDLVSPTELWDLPQSVFSLLYTPDSYGEFRSGKSQNSHALRRLFGSFTNNGRFAFLKGLLAHLSRPVFGSPNTIGVLLRPLVALHVNTAPKKHENSESCAKEAKEDEKEETIVYDIIVPFAERFCSAIQEPETRFMAIQTMDSVVRHAAACFSFMLSWLCTKTAGISKDINPIYNPDTLTMDFIRCQRKKDRHGKDLFASMNPSDSAVSLECPTPYEDAVFSLFHACSLFPAKLERTLYNITQLIMGLWDDGTQSMSGALYETYDQTLLAKRQFRSLQAFFHPSFSILAGKNGGEGGGGGGNVAEEGSFTDSMETLLRVLAIQGDRRARYHALLGLFSVIPLPQILQVLDNFYIKNAGADTSFTTVGKPLSLAHEPALVCFAESLLSGASNHKVGNVCGDVFVKLARLLNPKSSESTRENSHSELSLVHLRELFDKGLVYPLGRAIAEEGYVRVVANVSESVNISNIIAHFVVPLLKQVHGTLPALIKSLMEFLEASGARRERVYQGVLEVLYRSRDAGLDISAFMAPLSEVFTIVESSLQAWSFDLRNIALRLCVLAHKRVEPIQAWQCKVVETFLLLNMHLGGDTTARKGLLDSYRKWVVQVVESFKRGAHRANASSRSSRRNKTEESDAKDVDEANKQILVSHCISCVHLFAEHYGLTIEQSQGLSIERRTLAASCFDIFLTELTSLTQEDVSQPWWQSFLRECFPCSIIKPLLADLSDGWSMARKCAKKLLLFYFQYAFPIVKATVDPESVLKASISELRSALTYSNAEGAVARFMLFDSQTPESHQAAAADPEKDLQKRAKHLLTEVAALASMCKEVQTLRENGMGVEACAFVRQHPLHGRLSLCMAILSGAASLFRASSDFKATRTAHSSILREASREFLKCSSEVLRTCSALVGSEPFMWSALSNYEAEKEGASSANSTEATHSVLVDCRGHVYDTNQRPGAEGLMRIVVNNTWLAIRNATLAVHLITVELRGLEELDFEVVRTIGFDLIDTLLSTKHNGVMRCVQDALRGLSEALLRCREPLFYTLPSAMADYLMGEVGVMSSDSSRMLRRSQGLPHAILSILDAEDRALPCFIFPNIMSRLLALVRREGPPAEAGQKELLKTPSEVQLSQRVNSLNVLKFIFEDRILAERAMPYLEEVFLFVTEGFSDPNWGIRNSSLMLFSSILQRFVGEHPSTGGVGVNTSLHDIIRRTPRAVSFALKILSQSSTSPSVLEPASPTDAPNLSIFPVLQMLSMLSPDPANLLNDTETSFPSLKEEETPENNAAFVNKEQDITDRIVNAVMRCGADRSLAARTASACALACVVPCSAVGASLRLLAALHFNPEGCTANSLHGGLVQLHRFHIQYVGTLMRHRRHCQLSNRATPDLAVGVSRTLADILLSNRNVLKRVCITCPAAAAACFELVSDLVYFGPSNGLDGEVLEGLLAWAMPILEGNICTPSPAYGRTKAYHGGVRRAGALCLLLAARFLHLQSREPGGSKCKATIFSSLQCILVQEVGTLDLASGFINITSLLLSHMHFYTTERRIFRKSELMEMVTDGLGAAYGIDLPSASLRALTKALREHCSGHAIGCVAWEEIMAHLEFAVSLLLRRAPLETNGLLDGDYQIVQECVLALLDSDAPRAELKTSLHPPEFRGAGLRFLVCRSLQREGVLSEKITKILSSCAGAENPLIVRKAVLEALSNCFEAFSARQKQQRLAEEEALAAVAESRGEISYDIGPLLHVLLGLLCDDAAEVRDAACGVCPLVLHACAVSDQGKVDVPSHFLMQDQTSSLLSIVLVLRRFLREKRISLDAMKTYFSSNSSPDLALPEVPCEAEAPGEGLGMIESDDDDIGDDILFQKEPDNMFMERVTLDYIAERLQNALHSHTTPVHTEGARHHLYDGLLSSAESAKKLRVRMIDPFDCSLTKTR